MSSSPPARLKSLDVFRGATIASMILVNSPGVREDSYPLLRHTAWNGWTFADTIFPAFLFIVGVSLTLSTAARVERGGDRASLIGHAVRRLPFETISSSRAFSRRSPSATSWHS